MAKKQNYSRVTIISGRKLTQLWIYNASIDRVARELTSRFRKRVYDKRPTKAVVASKQWSAPAPKVVDFV